MITRDNLYLKSSAFWDQNSSDLRSLLGDDLYDAEMKLLDESYSEEEFLEQVKVELRQNYQFTLVSILPGLAPDISTLKKTAKKMEIETTQLNQFAHRLLKAGLWTVQGGRVETNFEFLNLGDISVKDYLSMTVSIISHLSDTKSYSYDTLSIVTNRSLIRGFISKVNSALGELNEKSHVPGIEKDTLFSWTHTGVIEHELKKKINNDMEN